jgi:beta-phosphoglucomutase-like phosphatase (HAD superfamily)
MEAAEDLQQPSATVEVPRRPRHRLELDTVAARWQLALDSAQHALSAASGLPASDLEPRRRELAHERQVTASMLVRLAHVAGVRPAPWLSRVPVSRQMLGLGGGVRACLFDLDGVLTDSALLHARAWAEVFDELLQRLAERAGWHFIPFDPDADYVAFVDGRPRLEGVHAFLGSRGIRLPEGQPDADTAYGLARHKSEALARGLQQRGVTAVTGARRYLEAAGHTGLKRAVVSASASTLLMLELAGLASLVEERTDAESIRREGLPSRPAPDLLVTVCGALGVPPETAVTFTHSPAGVTAGRAAGLDVIGVGDGADGELLRSLGAERVVPSLSALLDRQLAGSSPPS